ncbi:Mitochondrial import receptor subunit TOM70 [Armadillidium nasatum]|uniref:Mitochondrial import receptor subunit TOM70 n=1 Tax=Armadillidium nasatum TaxID=96803 RepID=A0A5N5SWJ7_9CRUS|nr:Mitochondrial import receptor subunit TOM70 [Armadillidium nasatum]
MSLSKFDSQDTGIPKWQIALSVGGAIIIGAGFYYFYLNRDSEIKKSGKPKSKPPPSSLSEDKSIESDADLSPLGRAQASKNKGNKYFKVGKYEEAIKCYDEAIEICPPDNKTDLSTFYQNRAAAYEQLKNWENVMRDCTAALELNSRYIKALQRRAKACEILKDLEQSLEDLTSVCILESFQNQGTLIHVDRVLKDIGVQRAKEAMATKEIFLPSRYYIKSYFDSFIEDPIFTSLCKEKEGDIDESEQQLEKNATNNGYLKAKQYLQEGKYSEIEECCSNELSNPLSSHVAESLLLRATIDFLKTDYKRAMQDLSKLIDMKDLSLKIKVNALIKRGTIYMHTDNLSSCLQDFRNAREMDPTNSDVYHHLGQIYLLVGNMDGATDNFNLAVKAQYKLSNCNYPEIIAHQKDQNADLTYFLHKFEDVIKSFPKCSECYMLYAQVLCDQEKFEEADKQYAKAIEVDPDNPTNYWKGDLDASKKMIMKALELDDKCELAYENLATIEVQTGNLKRGVELFEKAIYLAKTEMEMAHLYSLHSAAISQLKVVDKLGLSLSTIE